MSLRMRVGHQPVRTQNNRRPYRVDTLGCHEASDRYGGSRRLWY